MPMTPTKPMTPFLKQVAEHYFKDNGQVILSDRVFVFPNRRSAVFFRKWLADVNKGSMKPFFAPTMLTIDDFFRQATGLKVEDRIPLLLRLYGCYKTLNPKAESLDEFIFWGDVLLRDFSDVDKYLIAPEKIFVNISDWKKIGGGDLSYLTENQRIAVEQFLRNFGDGPEKEFKEKFRGVWDLLLPLYRNFTLSLEKDGKAYDGAIYRKLAEDMKEKPAVDVLEDAFPGKRSFVFVGLNALDECERVVLGKMRDAGIAEFCWDWPKEKHPLLTAPENKAGLFMRGTAGKKGNISLFPQAFSLEPVDSEPVFHVIDVPSAVGQVKLLPNIMDEETAVVLPDESLLDPLLRTLPPSVRHINVTMGRSMTGSMFFGLLRSLLAMQLHLRNRDGAWLFYHAQVRAILSNGLLRSVMTEEESTLADRIFHGVKYYIPLEDFSTAGGKSLIDMIFRPVVTDTGTPDNAQVRRLEGYLVGIVSEVASRIDADEKQNGEAEFAHACIASVRQLSKAGLEVLPQTYSRILLQSLAGLSVPFNGEPLQGMQVMGPLETRSLDFRKVAILSCDEGVFPRKTVSSSFIPPELRQGFGLPTSEYQDAVWAYYFYRLVLRAGEVWLLHDSRTSGVGTGEESRYIRQLEYGFGISLDRKVSTAGVSATTVSDLIEKTPEIIGKLMDMEYSASSLQSYLKCPAQFYYSKVMELRPEDEITEELDTGMLGDVYHSALCDLYGEDYGARGGIVTAEALKALREDKGRIKSLVDSKIEEQLHSGAVTGKNLVYEEVVCRFIDETLRRDIEHLSGDSTGKRHDGYKILGREMKLRSVFHTPKGDFRLKGTLDRLDMFTGDESAVRVVDYKTGTVEDNDIDISDDNAGKIAEAVFTGANKAHWPKIALQIYIYDYLLRNSGETRDIAGGRNVLNAIYSTRRLFSSPVSDVPESQAFGEEMCIRLSDLFEEIVDPDTPFVADWRPGEFGHCKNCDFREICRR